MSSYIECSSLAGKTALVAWAPKGIGLETCLVLADTGTDIAAVALDPADLEEAVGNVEATGQKASRSKRTCRP